MDGQRGKIRKIRNQNLQKTCDKPAISNTPHLETENGEMASRTGSGQSWEEQLSHALSMEGTLPRTLEAYINMRVEEEVEARLAPIMERLQKIEETLLGNSEETDFRSLLFTPADSEEHDVATTPTSAAAPEPVPSSPLPETLRRFVEANPPVPSSQSPMFSMTANRFKDRVLFPQPLPPGLKLVTLPPYQPRPIPSFSLSDTWLSGASDCSLSSNFSSESTEDVLGLMKLIKPGREEQAGGAGTNTAGNTLGGHTRGGHFKSHLPPLLTATRTLKPRRVLPTAIIPPQVEIVPVQETPNRPLSEDQEDRVPIRIRVKAILDRYKAREANEKSSPPPPATVTPEGHSTPPSEEQNSAPPCLMRATPTQKSNTMSLSQGQNASQPPSGKNIPETNGYAPKPPTQGQKKESVRQRRYFSSKAGPSSTTMEKSDKPSLGRTNVTKEKEIFLPFVKPQAALNQAFQLLGSDDWERRIEGLNSIRRLVRFHPGVLTPKLHSICLAVVGEVQNLRSLVSRAAVATLGDLYLHLQHTMDPELDWTAKVLLQKAGESNQFIRQEVGVALGHMLRSCTPTRCMKALLSGGLSDRNVAVRECNARQLVALVEIMGTAGLLSCKKAIMNNFLSAVSQLPQDASQEVRSCGKNIIQLLSAHEELKNQLAKFL